LTSWKFGQIENQIRTFSEELTIVDAMKKFPQAEKNATSEAGVSASQIEQMREHLKSYYTGEFGVKFAEKNEGATAPIDAQFSPLDNDSVYLQYKYISENPNPLGEKENLNAADDNTTYSKLHGKIHPQVRSYLRKFGYYDIFLCDLDTGDIVYSVFKELDFTTSLSEGPYSETNFGRAFKLAAEAENKDDVFLVDYETYVPSYQDPASFISTPIFDGDKKIGVAIFQMPIDKISAIMNERTGLGKSGETYAVGPEGLFRNDSRFLDQLNTDTTVINPEFTCKTLAVTESFAGNGGRQVIDDYRGYPVLSSWSPLTVYEGVEGHAEPITWALMSEIDEAEVKEPLGFLNVAKSGIQVIIPFALGALAICWFIGSRLKRQSDSIKDMLTNVGIGIFDARAERITNDELGDVADALNAMSDTTLTLLESEDQRQGVQESIEGLIGQMEEIASGNLGVSAEIREDITGEIAGTVNHMTEQLRTIVQQVQNATYMVTSSADDIADASTKLSEENDAQANEIQVTSNEVLEITAKFQDVAKQTEDSREVAQKARETANRGYQAVTDTVEGMERIREQVQSTSMAGDAGQGFAVVAEEVERLAERATDATKQISTLIKAIQSGTSEAISDMEEATREVVEGSQLATQAGQRLAEINDVSQQLEESIQVVSGSALEQADAATKIATRMKTISQTTKDSAEKSRSATNQVNALATLANQLGDSVSRFNLDYADETEQAIMDDIEDVSSIVGDQEHGSVQADQSVEA